MREALFVGAEKPRAGDAGLRAASLKAWGASLAAGRKGGSGGDRPPADAETRGSVPRPAGFPDVFGRDRSEIRWRESAGAIVENRSGADFCP